MPGWYQIQAPRISSGERVGLRFPDDRRGPTLGWAPAPLFGRQNPAAGSDDPNPGAELPGNCRLLMQWTRAYAAHLYEQSAPQRIEALLEKHKLMDDDTEIPEWVRIE